MTTQVLHYHFDIGHGLGAGLKRGLRLLARWSERARQRRQLAGLDADRLRDIGISREQALAEAAKPFWE